MRERLAQLLDAQGRSLHALLLRITLNREAAADLFQELFVRLAGSSGFAGAKDHVSFAFRTAINLANDWRRDRRRRTSVPLPQDLRARDCAAFGATTAEELARVLDAVSRLRQPARDAVCLRYLMQMPYREVGRAIGRSAHQARALCHSAISRLRKELSEERRVDHVARKQ